MYAMRWIYLSPHLDDVVLSCGGLIWEQARSGEKIEIWTVCSGDPPGDLPLTPFAQELHARWQTGAEAIAQRRREERSACRKLRARPRFLGVPDCIYRRSPDGRPLVGGEDDLWNATPETHLVNSLAARLAREAPSDAALVSPLGLGRHVDHRLARNAAERLERPLYYYADYPYVQRGERLDAQATAPDWQHTSVAISPAGLAAWQAAVAEYRSQISTFWPGLEEMRAAIRQYWSQGGGSSLDYKG